MLRIARRTTTEIETAGFQQERDTGVLQRLYGSSTYSRERLQKEYSVWFHTAEASEDERVREGYATPEQCKHNMLDEIEEEIRRLKDRHKRNASHEREQNEIELLRRKCNRIRMKVHRNKDQGN
jgi:hypothetical protein